MWFGRLQERMAELEEGCYEDKGDEDGEVGGSKRQSDARGRRRERLKFVRDGEECNMKFLDADVKRPSASVSATVDE